MGSCWNSYPSSFNIERLDMPETLMLIWQCVPESTAVYLFDTDTHAAKLARQCAGIYINGSKTDDNHPIHELYDLLEHNTALDSNEVLKGNFTEVVICGFIL